MGSIKAAVTLRSLMTIAVCVILKVYFSFPITNASQHNLNPSLLFPKPASLCLLD